MRSLIGLPAIAALVVLLVGCASASPSPSDRSSAAPTAAPDYVQIVGGVEHTRRLRIYDRQGLIAGVGPANIPGDPMPDAWWSPVGGDASSLILGWLGGVCNDDPTLTVSRQGSTTALALFDGHPISLPPGQACPAVGIMYEVELSFDEAISGLDIALRMIR